MPAILSKRQFYAVTVSVLETMDECERDGLPIVASSIYLALEAQGFNAMRTIEALVVAGFVENHGDTLAPTAKGREIMQLLRATWQRGAAT